MQQPSASNRPSLEHRVQVEQARTLFASLPSSIVLGSLVVALLVYMHWSSRPESGLIGWAGAFVLVSLARAGLLLRVRATRAYRDAPGPWLIAFGVLTVMVGAIWGSSAWVLLRPVGELEQTFLMFSIAGLAAGGIINLAGSWRIAWVFLAATLVPFMVRFGLFQGEDALPWIALVGLYLLALMAMSLRLARETEYRIRERLLQGDDAERQISEQVMYRTLVESTTAVLWEADAGGGGHSYVSPEVETVLGYRPSAWISDKRFWDNRIHPEDRDWVVSYCRREARARRSHALEYRMLAADGSVVWVRDSVNVVALEDGRTRLVGAMVDVTEQHIAQRSIEYGAGLQRLMVDASREFMQVEPRGLDVLLTRTLARVGEWCNVDRAYLIRFSGDHQHFTNTHEWVAAGVTEEIHNLQREPTSRIPNVLARLEQREALMVSSVAQLGPDWASEKALFNSQDIQSLICLPVVASDVLIGLVGFDSVGRERAWTDQEVSLLQVLGDLVGAAIHRAEVEERLRASESLRRHAEALACMGSWQWDIGSDGFEASDEWRKVTGVGSVTLTREDVLGLTPEEERPLVEAALAETVARGTSYKLEHRIVRPDNGETRWIKVHADLFEKENGTPALRGFAQDITERKQDAEALFRLAHYDNLTGLPNRVLALDRLDQSLKHAHRSKQSVSMLFLDLDHFKKINDTLGHSVGDRILQQAAERLVEHLREDDTVARIGGDEFLILLDDTADERRLVGLANQLLRSFREPFILDGREMMLTLSIGIAVYPQDGETADELMRNADTAMYHAKGEGRNGFQFFTAAMNEDVSRQLEIEESLRTAIDRGELNLLYQPIVRVRDGQPVGAEALLRWTHPQLGRISPEEFIPLAEHVGLIEAIGDFVMRNGFRQLARWHAAGYEQMRLSINVSPRQFREESLAENLLVALDTFGLKPTSISIEITEGVLLSGADSVMRTLRTLRDYGVGIVMDDFGTGFSSLGYLRDYPFDVLKIDRRFVQGIETDKADQQLVVSAIRLGQALGMAVVAEGVETEAQDQLLVREGCDYAQGYRYGHPMPAEEFLASLEHVITLSLSQN
jgi:diguanylate cyclase (GGDEF)-like protein/PAS domain S-box-containing protein